MCVGDFFIIVDSDGLKWVVRPGTDDNLGPGHETFLNSAMHIPEGGVFVDIGAHVGHFALRMAKTASKVIAVECGQYQMLGLLKNIQLNNIQNITIWQAAASDHIGHITLTHPGGNYGHGGHYGQTVAKDSPTGEVACYTLDYMLLGPSATPVDRIDLIKVDVQGSEARVLRGMKEVLAKYKPRLVVELHDREFNDPTIWTDTQAELKAMNYKWNFIHELGTNWWIECVPGEQ